MLILPTSLLWLISLFPKVPPPLLAKKTSSVSETYIGASCANANVSLDATSWIDGSDPSIVKKASLKIWKNGGSVEVGLKNLENDESRKEPVAPRTANDRGSTNWGKGFGMTIYSSDKIGLIPLIVVAVRKRLSFHHLSHRCIKRTPPRRTQEQMKSCFSSTGNPILKWAVGFLRIPGVRPSFMTRRIIGSL